MNEILFKYNDECLLNINDVFRRQIREVYERQNLGPKDGMATMECFKEIFLKMYEEDRNSYRIYIQIMIADAYKILLHEIKQNTISNERIFSFDILRNFELNVDNMIRYIDTKAGIFEEIIECSIAFDKMNLLGRKTVVQNSRDYDTTISKISPLHALDILHYGEKTTTDELLNYYMETVDLIITKPEILANNILSHMKHLYIFNKENYLENIKEMGRVFYKFEKISVKNMIVDKDSKIHEYLKIIEENDIETLGNLLLYDYDFLFHIIIDFCMFKTDFGIKIGNEIYNEEIVDEIMKNEYPTSLEQSIQKRKK